MKILHRYFLRYLFTFAAISMAVTVVLYISIDFSEKFDEFSKADIPAKEVTLYFAIKIPSIISQTLIPVSAISTLLTYITLYYRKELIAFYSAGVSPRNYLFPVTVFGITLFFLYLIGGDWLERPLSAEANKFWVERVKKTSHHSAEFKEGEIWFATRNRIYHFRYYNPHTKLFHGISINVVSDDFQLLKRIEADTAYWEENRWILKGVTILEISGEAIKLEKTPVLFLEIEEKPSDFIALQKLPELLSIPQLLKIVKLMKKEGVNPKAYLLELSIRLSNAVALVTTVLLCASLLSRITLLLFREQIWITLGVVLIFSAFLGFLYLAVALAYAGYIPLWGIWLPHGFALVASYKISK